MRKDLIDRHTWSGIVDAENVEAIAQRLFNTLNGKLYTFVAYNSGFSPESSIGVDVDVDRYLERSTSGNPIIVDNEQKDWGWYSHVTVVDSYGVWGFSSGAYVSFEGDYKIKIIHKAPAGHDLVWKINVQNQDAPTKF